MNKIFYFSLIYFFIEIRIFLSQICGKKEPKNITDCIENSYEDQACCFITYNQTVYGCLFVPQNSTFITQYINSIDFGLDQLFTIKIDCGKDQEKDKRICARNPSNKFDCFQNTNSTYDCCFFQTPDQDLCLWNDNNFRTNTNIFGTNITCYNDIKNDFIKINSFRTNFIFLLFLIILIS